MKESPDLAPWLRLEKPDYESPTMKARPRKLGPHRNKESLALHSRNTCTRRLTCCPVESPTASRCPASWSACCWASATTPTSSAATPRATGPSATSPSFPARTCRRPRSRPRPRPRRSPASTSRRRRRTSPASSSRRSRIASSARSRRSASSRRWSTRGSSR
jgi:hypothetical protein